jgi:hypothetical protein
MKQQQSILWACLCLCIRAKSSAFLDAAPASLDSTIKLLQDVERKVTSDADAQTKAYQQYESWCKSQSTEQASEVDARQKQLAKLDAAITEGNSAGQASDSSIDRLMSQVALQETRLAEATTRFQNELKETQTAIDTLEKSIAVLDQTNAAVTQQSKFSASVNFLQEVAPQETTSVSDSLMALAALIDSAGIMSSNATQLVSLFQQDRNGQQEGNNQKPTQATVGTSNGDSDTTGSLLKSMQAQAEASLKNARQQKVQVSNSFETRKSTIQGIISVLQKSISDEKVRLVTYASDQQQAAIDKSRLTQEFKTLQDALKKTQDTCMQAAVDQQNTEAGREEELGVLRKAREMLTSLVKTSLLETHREVTEEDTSADGSYALIQLAADIGSKHFGQLEEAQGTRRQFQEDGPGHEALRLIRSLAKEQHSPMLAQLASRVAVAVRSAGRRDPLSSITKMVQDMIVKLQDEASSSATEYAYCKSEMSRSKDRIEVLKQTTGSLNVSINSAASKSALLRVQVSKVRNELVQLQQQTSNMTAARQRFSANYQRSKDTLQNSLDGIQQCITVLKTYYQKPSLLQQSTQSKGVALMAASMGLSLGSESSSEVSQARMVSDTEEAAADSAEAQAEAVVQSANNALSNDAMTSTGESVLTVQQDQPQMPPTYQPNGPGGASVIRLLETCQSDFAKNLAELEDQESSQKTQYENMLSENKVLQAGKQTSIELSEQEIRRLDADARQMASDLDDATKELDPLQTYYAQVMARCKDVNKTASSDVSNTRQAQIDSLKQALALVKGQQSLAQFLSHQVQKRSSSFLQRGQKQGKDALKERHALLPSAA